MEKDTVDVNWCLFLKHDLTDLVGIEPLLIDPQPLYEFISDTRKGSQFLKCYAFIDFCKNFFVIKAPFDMTVYVDKKTQSTRVEAATPLSFEFLDYLVTNRYGQNGEGKNLLLTLAPKLIFWSQESLVMESTPLPLTTDGCLSNTLAIPGKYDIGKWVRPIDFSFEIVDDAEPIVIKRGDPLFGVRFMTEKTVKLHRVKRTADLAVAAIACACVKQFERNIPLRRAYELADKFLRLFGFKKDQK